MTAYMPPRMLVEYFVYINKTKTIERKKEMFSYKYKKNWLRKVDDFSTVLKWVKEQYKTTDIVWIIRVEVTWWNLSAMHNWYLWEFEEFLKTKWKILNQSYVWISPINRSAGIR